MTLLFSHGGVETRIADTEREHTLLMGFMREHALRIFGCEPPPSLGTIIGAWQGETVLGSLALDFRENSAPFPLEEFYDKHAFEELFPEGFKRQYIVQAGRWFSARPGSPVSALLLYGMQIHARAHGRRWALGEAKLYTLERFKELGYQATSVPGYLPDLTKIPMEGRRYYDLPPHPQLFRLYL